MNSRERVLAAMRGGQPDRVPLNVFAGWNPGVRKRVDARYGHVDSFYREFGVDIVSAFLPRFPFGRPEPGAEVPDIAHYVDAEMIDPGAAGLLDTPCDDDLFLTVNEAVRYRDSGKAVFVNVWGIFETSQFLFEVDGKPGTEQALINMLAEREKTQRVYYRLAEWAAAAAENAIQAGADVIEISDDWGQQNTMMFSPVLWREMVQPALKIIVDTVKRHHVPVLLHSDGDISMVLDGVRDLGFDGLHPVQESAGMSFARTREALGRNVCIMGGLDTMTALPIMDAASIREEVRRVFSVLKPGGPFIFAGSHMFQDDTPIEIIEAAYDEARIQAPY